ncbi:MAG: hypothetical protein ACYCST_05900 [Acidimicrobiales bacterium]
MLVLSEPEHKRVAGVAAQVIKVVVEHLHRTASEFACLLGEDRERSGPFVGVGCRRAEGEHLEVAVGVGFASGERSEDQDGAANRSASDDAKVRELADDPRRARPPPAMLVRAETGTSASIRPKATVSRPTAPGMTASTGRR